MTELHTRVLRPARPHRIPKVDWETPLAGPYITLTAAELAAENAGGTVLTEYLRAEQARGGAGWYVLRVGQPPSAATGSVGAPGQPPGTNTPTA